MNRQFLVFLFFLCLSTAFWFILALDQEYEFEVSIPVKLVNVPDKVVVTTDLPKEIKVTLKDKGVTMLRYKYGSILKTISFSFSTYTDVVGHSVVSESDLSKVVSQQLLAGTRLMNIHPATLEFFYNNGLSKRLPIRMTGKIYPNELFYISSIRIVPDSVTVYASASVLDTLKEVKLNSVYKRNLSDTISFVRGFQPIRGAKILPTLAHIFIKVDQLTEKTVQVPVQWVNFPASKVLRTFPANVSVTFQVGTSAYKNITADNFIIVVNYEQVQNSKSNKCHLSLKTIPPGVSHVRISPETVEYVIEDAPEN